METTELANHVIDSERLKALHETALLDTPAEEGFDRLTRLATRLLKAPVSLVTLIDSDRQFFKSSVGVPEPWQTLRETPLSHSFCQHNRIPGHPLLIEDARKHPVFKDNPAIRDLHVIAYLGIPLVTPDGYVLGSFCVIDSRPRSWNHDDISVLEDLAGAVMSEICLRTEISEKKKTTGERDEQLRLNEQLRREVSAREEAEQSLRESEEFNRRISRILPSVLYIFDLSTRSTTFLNKAVNSVLEYSPEEVMSMGDAFLPSIMHPDDFPSFKDHIDRLSRQTSDSIAEFEYRMLAADGTWRWMLSRDTVFERGEEGEPILILGTATDNTSRKQASDALREANGHLETTLHSIADGVIATDQEGTIVRMNRTAENLTGWNYTEALGKPLSEIFRIINSQTRQPLQDPVSRVLSSGKVVGLANGTALLSRDGKEYLIADSGAPIRDDHGKITGVVLVFSDWTERYCLQKQIKENEQKFRTIFEQSADGVLLVRDTIIDCNEGAAQLLRSTREEIIGKTPADFAPPVQKGGERTQQLQYAIWEKAYAGKPQRFTWQMCRADGEIAELDVQLKAIEIQGEKALLATGRDLTELKRNEEKLRRSEERYRLAQRLARVGTWEWNLEEDRMFWSDTVAPMWGLSPEQFDGTYEGVAQRIHPDDVQGWREDIRASIEQKKEHNLEFRIIKPDKSIRWIATYGNTQFDQRGKPTRMMGMVMDITDRREAEEHVRSSLREKEMLLLEIYHRTKNNMQVISAFLELQAMATGDERIIKIVQESGTRIRTMALAHEKLYKGKSLSRINMQEYVEDLAHLIATGSGMPGERVHLFADIESFESLIDIAIPLGLIITELLSNAFKHAFPEDRTGEVRIQLYHRKQNLLELVVSDNGIGLPKGFDAQKSPTLGIQLVYQIARRQLHGEVETENGTGVRWIIRFSEGLYHERI